MPFDTDDEAVKLANDTVYGLECQQGNKRVPVSGENGGKAFA
jgi:hypothetical protein